jgi:hypothetical protein
MRHADGRVINCQASGFGWIGAPAALLIRKECVDNAKAAGFVEADGVASVPPAPVAKYQGRSAIKLSDGWVRVPPPPAAASVTLDFAKNETYGAYMQLTYVNSRDVTSFQAWSATRRGEQLSRLSDAIASELTATTVNGLPAFHTDIEGTLAATGNRLRYRQTMINAGSDYLVLAVWAPAPVYVGSAKEYLDGVVSGLLVQ